MPDIVDDNGNIWLHGREAAQILVTAEDPAQDASTWTLVFRTADAFEKSLTVHPSLAKTLVLTITEDEADNFPLVTEVTGDDAGTEFVIMDESVPGLPSMLMQGRVARYGFE